MKEKILQTGGKTPLIGVITLADQEKFNGCALILLNSGIHHHVGYARLSVKLTRAAARLGLLGVRFDFSGIGDSPVSVHLGGDNRKRAGGELCSVMDHLEENEGIKSFVVGGICYGADIAMETSWRDSRIKGLIQLDAHAYPTMKSLAYKAWHKSLKALDLSFLAQKSRQLLEQGANGSSLEGVSMVKGRIIRPRKLVEMELRRLIERKVEFFYVFTNGGTGGYAYKEQLYDMFSLDREKWQLSLTYFPDSDHLLTGPRHQKELLSGFLDWVSCHFAKNVKKDFIGDKVAREENPHDEASSGL